MTCRDDCSFDPPCPSCEQSERRILQSFQILSQSLHLVFHAVAILQISSVDVLQVMALATQLQHNMKNILFNLCE